jgi:hypothetical protein
MKYNEFTLGQVEAVFNKLGGPEGIADFLSGRTKIVKTHFNIWKNLKLGTFKNADDLYQRTKEANFDISEIENEIFCLFTTSTQGEVQIINISLRELGFNNGADYQDICARAKEFGLEFCSNEVGLCLRLQYNDQPKDENFWVGMEALESENFGLQIMCMGHDDNGLWLRTGYGFPNREFNADDHFVFCLCK